jgi:hypothetical protein
MMNFVGEHKVVIAVIFFVFFVIPRIVRYARIIRSERARERRSKLLLKQKQEIIFLACVIFSKLIEKFHKNREVFHNNVMTEGYWGDLILFLDRVQETYPDDPTVERVVKLSAQVSHSIMWPGALSGIDDTSNLLSVVEFLKKIKNEAEEIASAKG